MSVIFTKFTHHPQNLLTHQCDAVNLYLFRSLLSWLDHQELQKRLK